MRQTRYILSIAAIATLFLALQTGGARAQTFVDGIAVIINDFVVTTSEYEQKRRKIERQVPEVSKTDVVNNIISEIIILQETKKRGIEVSAEELKAAADEIKNSLKLNDEGFMKMLAGKNSSLKEFFDEIKLQILSRKLIQSEVALSGLSIDDKKIEQYYMLKNPGADTAARVRIAHILMPREDESSLGKAKQIAHKAQSGGEDFAVLAKKHSVDISTAEKGGDLGYFKYEELIKPLLQAVDGAQTGDINGPVESKFGFHIVKVMSIKEEGTIVPEELKNALVEEIATKESERIISSLIEKGFKSSHIDIRI